MQDNTIDKKPSYLQ